MKGDFYVYIYRNAEGAPVYVGKGRLGRDTEHLHLAEKYNEGKRKDRAYRFTKWLAKELREGRLHIPERYAENLEECVALELEKELIQTFGLKRKGGTLLNITSGGDGITSADAKRFANTPETKRKKAESMAKLRADPVYRARVRAAHAEANRRPHRREQQRAMAIEKWSDRANREKARARAKELWADPVWAAARRRELMERNSKAKLERINDSGN